MGFKDVVSALTPDSAEDWIEDRVEDVGGYVDKGTDWAADQLEGAGWDRGAGFVREKGDSVANRLGADVGEMRLGQTDDPKKLIHGSPDKLRSTAGHLDDFRKAFDNVGRGLKGLDSSELKGEAADAFREKAALEPPRWFKAADACEKAAKALRDFAGTVEWAQRQAQEAIDRYRRGEEASDAYREKVDAYNHAVMLRRTGLGGDGPLPDRPPSEDPGASEMRAAQEILDEARRQRDEAEAEAASAVAAARDTAPAKPSYGDQFVDGLVGMHLNASHFYGGVFKGTAGVINFARGLNPTDPYNLTHPAEYLTNLNSTAAGLVRTVNDPMGTLQNAWEGFRQDPSEGLGRLVPELLGTRGAGSVKKLITAGKLPHNKPDAPPPPKDWSDLAQPAKHVSEKAIHADSVPSRKAREFIEDQYPWLKDVNRTGEPGYTVNCSRNVIAVDRRLDGHEATAEPLQQPAHVNPAELGAPNRPVGQYDYVNSYDDLIKDLQARGEGSRSVVYISRPDGTAHVFNAVNTRHGVVFLDGQSGTLGRLEGNVSSIGHIPYR
ncbi:hypothetical protein GCM10010420_21170 [Streptomyces glaucosporus]|uniref:Tox-PL domain-containing protein n=1 Tax=Streptomyces glaucosporus TaxID=284044 RepID=A0ABN3I6V3_9ACTN